MNQAKREADSGTWLRRAWNAVLRTAEAIERSPMDDVFDRLERLERDMVALKQRKYGRTDG